MLVQGNEAIEYIITRRRIVRSAFIKIRLLVPLAAGANLDELAFIIREVILHWADWKLLFKPIDLVQEQDDGGFDEPSRVADGVEERQGLLHPVDGLVFE